jgi:hypothetical protein
MFLFYILFEYFDGKVFKINKQKLRKLVIFKVFQEVLFSKISAIFEKLNQKKNS